MSLEIKKKRSPWPYGIVIFFICLALFDAYIVTRALQTKTGTTTDNPYEDSLVYERIIQAKSAAKDMGLKAEFHLSTQSKKYSTVKIQGLVVPGEKTISLELVKPDDPSLDRQISKKTDTNEFEFEDLKLKPGLWILRALVSFNNKDYFFESKEIIE